MNPPPLPSEKKKSGGPLKFLALGCVGILGCLLIAGVGYLSYIGTMGPETYAVKGRQMKAVHKRVINELKLLEDGESIQWFYSDALTDICGGMYFATDRRMVLYSREWDEPLFAVYFTNLAGAEMETNSSFFEDSLVTIETWDDEEGYFPVSSERGNDERFFDYLLDKVSPRPDGNIRLRAILKKWSQEGGELSSMLGDHEDNDLVSTNDADAVVEALRATSLTNRLETSATFSSFYSLASFFQQIGTDEAYEHLVQHGLPELRRLLDEGLKVPEHRESDLLYTLKILAMYQQEQDAKKVVGVVKSGFETDGYMWSTILGQFDEDHDHWRTLLDGLRNPLPEGFTAIAYLDVANELALAEELKRHPFDSDAGVTKLRAWLSSKDEEEFSYAHSSTVALPFLSSDNRRKLLPIAEKHPDEEVQLESAWAAAKAGDEDGAARLSRWALDVNHSHVACQYMEELGLEKEIPKSAREPDFAAMAEMVNWLKHPNEFGRAPDKIEQVDTRELFWPPTDDTRQVWLFKYTYQPESKDEEIDIGHCMVGSVTFALFGTDSETIQPAEVYGLHCAYELGWNEDPRAPEEKTAAAGLKILREKNKDL